MSEEERAQELRLWKKALRRRVWAVEKEPEEVLAGGALGGAVWGSRTQGDWKN